MDPISAIAVVLAAAVTGFVTWSVAKRAKSGAIKTSEATTLWDEGTNMRRELRDEVVALKTQLASAITAIADLNREIRASRSEAERARAETQQSREETQQLRSEIRELHSEVKTYNTLTMGALADNAETRRILEVPKEDRTDVEFTHLAGVGQRQPEGEHPPIAPDELRSSDVQTEDDPL